MYKHTQRSFAGGQLDAELMGRQDLEKYFTGASRLQNLLVRRQGNLAKRRGTSFCADIGNILGKTIDRKTGGELTHRFGASRLVPIVYGRETGYYALLSGRRAFLVGGGGVYHTDGVWRREVHPYYNPQSSAGVCDASEAECFIEDIPYRTLRHGMALCPPGRTVKLAKDVALDRLITSRGLLDLNGRTVTVTRAGAGISFVGGSDVGVVDSTHFGATNIMWDLPDGTPLTRGDILFRATNCRRFLMDGVHVAYPYTGAGASLVSIAASVDAARFSNCEVAASAGRGVVSFLGSDPDPDRGIVVEECDFTTLDPNSPMFHNAASGSTAVRRVVVDSGYYSCAGAFANKGVLVRGGVVKCSSLGGGPANTSVVAGLLSYGVDQSLVAEGSELKGRTLDPSAFVELYNYNLAAEGMYVYARNPAPQTPPAALGRTVPYGIDIPYEDGDLETLDTYQSGDTIFIAHRNYPPAKLMFFPDGMKLVFEVLAFNATTWKQPNIVSVEQNVHPVDNVMSVQGGVTYRTTTSHATTTSGCTKTSAVYRVGGASDTLVSSSTSELPVRTVQYAVTYVKDGVESPPSNPVSVTYGAPWEQGGVVKIAFDRGGNAEEPDHYNVYKKENTEFGLIGSTVQPSVTDLIPEVASFDPEDGSEGSPVMSATGRFNEEPLAGTDVQDVLSPADGGVVTDVGSRVVGAFGAYEVYRGAGGAEFGRWAKLSFGDQSGAAVNAVKIWFDTHELAYTEDVASGKVKVDELIGGSGKRVYARVTFRNRTGSQDLEQQTVSADLETISYTPEGGGASATYSGDVVHHCGEFDPGVTARALRAAIAREPRSATLAFSSVTAEKQIVSLEIMCKDEFDDGEGGTYWEEVPVRICGISFGLARSTARTFEDDYITPDMSIAPPSRESAFRGRGNYPSCVGIYQQRLVFAATASRPFAFWMSAVGDLYTFAAHPSIREDDAIEAELAATEFPRINHLVFNRDLVMLSDGGEWKIAPVSGNALTYKTLAATLQSQIGSAKWLKPITVGNEIVFAERTGMVLRSIVYNYASDGYESQDLSVLAGNIFADNAILRMCYKQHPDSTIVCVLADGSVATLVYMSEHGVAAWSRHILGGGAHAVDCATCKAVDGTTTDVALTVRRGDAVELWRVRPDDHAMTVAAQVCMDGVHTLSGEAAAAAWTAGWTAVDALTAEVHGSPDALDGGRTYICGFPFVAELVTVRPEPPSAGTIQFEVKNAKDVEVRLLNSGAWRAAPFGFADSGIYAQRVTPRIAAADGALALDSSDHRLLLSGKNSGDGRVQLKSDDPWPLNILSISTDYEIQPLANSEG